ncbi:MAG: type II secretion system protein [Pseudomonadota bacterium]
MVRQGRRRAAGFTYLSLIIVVSIIALVAAAGLKMGALLQRRAAEQELLEIGAEFSAALKSYATATPPGQPQQPPQLQDLLKDPRAPNIRRHLRKLYADPMTGKAEWGVMYVAGDVGVVGVYSLSQAQPIKLSNFDARFPNFDDKEHLSDWKFTMAGPAGSAVPQPTVPFPPGAINPVPAPAGNPNANPGADPATNPGAVPGANPKLRPDVVPPRPAPISPAVPPPAPPVNEPLPPPSEPASP